MARARLEHRLPRVRLRQLALGDRRRPAQPALRPGPRLGLERDDPAGDAGAAAALPPGLLGLRRRAARERGAARTRRRARPRRRAPAPSAARQGNERDAPRDGVRAPALRPLPDRAARRLRDGDGEAAALGGHRGRGRGARRAGPARGRRPLGPRRRSHADPRRAHGAAAARDGPAGPRRAPHARSGGQRDLLPDRRLGVPAPRRLGRDGGVRAARSAARGRARPAADEHRDRLPALARQRRAAPGGRRAAAPPVRRRLRHGVRVRARAPGRRDVGRRRRRARDARARGPLARLAQADGGRRGGLGRGRARRPGRRAGRSCTTSRRTTTPGPYVTQARSRR